MDLGNFFHILTVRDLKASRAFYEALGFEVCDSEEKEDWLMLEQDGVYIGLFHGVFDKNVMYFTPPDVRAIQTSLKERGIEFKREADEGTTGPASVQLEDPDGNAILLEQSE